jgi:hypothetical protein
MADFKALFVDKGVGDYHFNRFRIRFEKPTGVTKNAFQNPCTRIGPDS